MFDEVTPVSRDDSKSEHESRAVTFESLERTSLSKDLAATLKDSAIYSVAVAIGGATIEVRFSRASAAAKFQRRYRSSLGHRGRDCIIYAVESEGAVYYWRVRERTRSWSGTCDDDLFVFFADNVAMHEYLTASSDLGLHAAVIARDQRVIALVGESTAGKTTTAIAAARRKFQVYSDEHCIIQDTFVVPFLRAITLRAGGRAALRNEARPDCAIDRVLANLPDHGDVAIGARTLLGNSAGGPPAKLEAIFLVEGRDETPQVVRCSVYDAMPTILHSMTSCESGIARPARMLEELRNVAIFRLRLGTPGATVDAIDRTIDEYLAGVSR